MVGPAWHKALKPLQRIVARIGYNATRQVTGDTWISHGLHGLASIHGSFRLVVPGATPATRWASAPPCLQPSGKA
jgi:hypothetical protein